MKGLVFTYALTYGGSVIALFNPFIGLLIYISFAIIKPDSMWYYSVPEGNYSRVIAVALLAGWVLRGCGVWQFGNAAGIVYVLIAFWAWSFISAMQAPQQDKAWPFVEEMTKIVFPFVVGITIIDSHAKLRTLAWVIVISQGYVAYELNLSYYQGFNRVQAIGFGGMDNNCVGLAMNTCIGLAVFLGLYSERWWQKLVAFATALVMAHVVLFTFSRGNMVALAITGFVCFLLIPKRAVHYAALLVIVLVVLRLAGAEVRERFMSSFADTGQRDSSATSRLELWRDCFDAAVKNPVIGVGPNHWALIAHTYGWPPGKEGHTLWLQVAAEMGFPGLLLLLLFYGRCTIRLRPLLRLSPASWPRCVACMVMASLVGFAVGAQFVSMAGLEVPYYVALLGAGVIKLTSVPVDVSDECDVDLPATAGLTSPVPASALP